MLHIGEKFPPTLLKVSLFHFFFFFISVCGTSLEFPACWNPSHRCQIKGKKKLKENKTLGLGLCLHYYVRMYSLLALLLMLLLIFLWVHLWRKQGTKGGMTGAETVEQSRK